MNRTEYAARRVLVMRYARLIGRKDGPKIVSVASRHFTVAEALLEMRARAGAAYWIVSRDHPAHVCRAVS